MAEWFGFDPFTLPSDDLLIRGGQHETAEKIYLSMLDHFRNPHTAKVWGLSVALMTGAAEPAILKAATQIRNRYYRAAIVQDFHLTGLHVNMDSTTHGLIWKQDEPTMEEVAFIAARFSEPRLNPHFDERRRRASR